jgi:hypothetical protein
MHILTQMRLFSNFDLKDKYYEALLCSHAYATSASQPNQ